MKKRMKRISLILSGLAVFASFTGMQVSRAEGGANGTAGVILKVQESTEESSSTDESSTDSSSTTDTTDSSTDTSSSSSGGNSGGNTGGNAGGNNGGAGNGSGGTSVTVPGGKKPIFPQTGEIVKGSLGVIGVGVVAIGLFFLWKNNRSNQTKRRRKTR